MTDSTSDILEELLNIELFEHQRELLDTDNQKRMLVKGRQAGGTTALSVYAIYQAISSPNETVVITTPRLRVADDIKRRIMEIFHEARLSLDELGITRHTRTQIEFANNSEIRFETITGVWKNYNFEDIDTFCVDCAAFADSVRLDLLVTNLLKEHTAMGAEGEADILLCSTPKFDPPMESVFKEYAFDNSWYLVQAKTTDNPLVEDGFVEERREELSEARYRVDYLGEFVEVA